jgi:hypothetical protein
MPECTGAARAREIVVDPGFVADPVHPVIIPN